MANATNSCGKLRNTWQLVVRILNVEFIRFCIVGGIATGIHYGVYLLFVDLINTNLAYTTGFIISWCYSLYLTSRFTFKSKANIKKGLGFAASHGINYLLHMGFLNLFLLMGVSKRTAPSDCLLLRNPY